MSTIFTERISIIVDNVLTPGQMFTHDPIELVIYPKAEDVLESYTVRISKMLGEEWESDHVLFGLEDCEGDSEECTQDQTLQYMKDQGLFAYASTLDVQKSVHVWMSDEYLLDMIRKDDISMMVHLFAHQIGVCVQEQVQGVVTSEGIKTHEAIDHYVAGSYGFCAVLAIQWMDELTDRLVKMIRERNRNQAPNP